MFYNSMMPQMGIKMGIDIPTGIKLNCAYTGNNRQRVHYTVMPRDNSLSQSCIGRNSLLQSPGDFQTDSKAFSKR
jgi:hypothetical protein